VTAVSLHLFCRSEAESAVRVLNSAILDNRVVRATWRELVSAVVQAAELLLNNRGALRSACLTKTALQNVHGLGIAGWSVGSNPHRACA
jgi:hypothetical protein